MEAPLDITVQAWPTGAARWLSLARDLEAAGFRGLAMADHPGTGPTPFVGLAAAAAVTSDLRLSTYVVNAGVRDQLSLAADVATLDVVSGGRVDLGIGAGHTPYEWEAIGRRRPSADARVSELIAKTTVVRSLIAGETVAADAAGSLADLHLDELAAVQKPVPLLIGGANRRLLEWAGGVADVVGLSGLGRTLPDGHRHEVRWSPENVDAQVATVRAGAAAAGRPVPALDALVQYVEVTDDRRTAAVALAEHHDVSVHDLLHVPYVWIGTVDEIADQLLTARHRWGIVRWTIREPAVGIGTAILRRLRQA